ncbi:MAG: D-glycero-beta-D-manno-heptose 1-phosphate adenylyltransferase [Phycisphaerales bacterium]
MSLLDHLAAWKPIRALVVGDFMLDRLSFGNADRLSNDAPVPVLHVQRTEERPGGSANVALDLAAMHARVRALGVVGDDRDGQELRRLLAAAGIDASAMVTDPTRPTTVKQSLIGLAQHRHPQKMFRLDYESSEPLNEACVARLLTAFESALPAIDVVCIEDYNKGVCTHAVCRGVIERARRAGKPVLVDPAAISDYSKYRGATAITPNRLEAQRAASVKPADDAPPEAYGEAALRLLEQHELDAVVITLDRHGALLLEREGPARVIPTVARRVYDVTGAGDMVLAALAAARGNAIPWPEAVKFANAAAGLEVEEFGVVPIALERIHADVLQRERATRGKLRTPAELAVEVAAARARGRTIVFTNGCFDVLHAGHVSLLRRAAELGGFLIVAVNDDDSVRRLKGPDRPVYPIGDRAQLLGELECVDAVVAFGEDTPEQVIRQVRPDVLVKGAQYAIDSIPGAAFVQSTGGRVELLEVVEGRSTTRTLEKIRAR